MINTSQLTSRPREKQLSFRLGSAEKSSARLAANGVIIKKNKNGGLTDCPLYAIINTERNERGK